MEKNTAAKEDIRNQLLRLRRRMDPVRWKADSTRIMERVVRHPWFLSADHLYCYMAVKGEAGTAGIIEKAWVMGKTVWLPKVFDGKNGQKGRMDFFQVRSFQELTEGIYQIPEPQNGAEIASGAEGLMILPGTAYDRGGHRMGYGGGYYDRYIEAHPELLRMGIAFEFQVVDALPWEDHDQRIDCLVTEGGTYRYEVRGKGGGKRMQMELPGDPALLLSVVNTKIRDYYHTLDALCEDMQIEKAEIVEKLKGIDYEYDESRHQFI